jgi:two-component system response regulator
MGVLDMNDKNFVLYVEDNPDDVMLTRLAFKQVDFPLEIVLAQDGAKALEFLMGTNKDTGKRPRPPAMILLDLNLPKVHGLEVLRRVRADPLLKHVFVVILTSSSEPQDQEEAKNLGAGVYIRKPVGFTEFLEVARRIAGFLSPVHSA